MISILLAFILYIPAAILLPVIMAIILLINDNKR